MKMIVTIAAAALVTQPLAAHPPGEHSPVAPAQIVQNTDEAAVRSVLADYKAAIERLDATGTERLFATESVIFETQGPPDRSQPAQKGAVPRRIGRTKGGLNSKLHAVCDGQGRPAPPWRCSDRPAFDRRGSAVTSRDATLN